MRRLPVFLVAVSVWSIICVGVASGAWTAPQTIPDLRTGMHELVLEIAGAAKQTLRVTVR